MDQQWNPNLFAYDMIDSSTQSTLVTSFWTIVVVSCIAFVVTAVTTLQYEKFDWRVRTFLLICGLVCLGMAIWRVYALHTGFEASPHIYNNQEFMYNLTSDRTQSFVFTPGVPLKNFEKARTRALLFAWAMVLLSLGACAAMVREWYTQYTQPPVAPYRNQSLSLNR